MFIKKIFGALAASAVCLATWQLTPILTSETVIAQIVSSDKEEKKTSDAVAPEVKEKAVELLTAVARETGQFAAPENRVRGQIQIAGLLWEHNETEARALFQNALSELQAMFNEVAAGQLGEDSADKNYSRRYKLSQLRSAYLLALAPHDPKAALAALQVLKTTASSGEEHDPLKGEDLELEIASAVAKKDPQQSYDLAVKNLKDGVTYNTMTTLNDLYKNDPDLGARLARDVLAKFKTAKVRRNSNNVSNTAVVTNINANASTGNAAGFYADLNQLNSFLQTAASLDRQAQKSTEKKTPLLTESEMRELSDLIAQVYLKQNVGEPWTIAGSMSIIAKYSPTAASSIRSKLNNEQLKMIESVGESSQYYSDRDQKTAEEIAAEAEKLPLSERDSRYADAVGKALEKDELEKAQEIAAKIKERKNYEYIFEQIKTDAPVIKARRGDIGEVRKMLTTLKSSDEKVSALSELVVALANKGEREAAGKLVEEAAQFLPGRLKRKTDLDTSLRVANAFAAAQPERAFDLLESSIGQMNELIAAGVLIDDFYDYQTVENDEILFEVMMRRGLQHTTSGAALIKNLATANFDRTVALADKFSRPEIRTFARLNIAMYLLDADAAAREKTLREQYQNEEEGH